MKNRIFKGIFSVATVVWIACLILILGAVYLQYSEEYSKELKSQAYLIGTAVEEKGSGYLEKINLMENHRITWISQDGRVIYDSKANSADMENHGKRPEVKDAMKKGYGEDTRYSKTLAEKTMYSAVRLKDGSVVRVSLTNFSVLTLLLSMMQPLLVVLVIAVCMSLFLAGRISRKIVEPINEINLEKPERSRIYDEVRPLIDKIEEQNREIESQISNLRISVDEKTREAEFRKEFTANVSHELKTPLTSISGFAELMKNDMVKDADIARFSDRIYREAQRLIVLVNDIIKLSQLDESNVPNSDDSVELSQIFNDTVYILEPEAVKKNINIDMPEKKVKVICNKKILEEIVYNICENAIKYNVDGGTIKIDLFDDGHKSGFSVKDTGIGIPKEDLDRVFERFYRVNKSHSKEIGGTGLGLSIVKHGVACIGGIIEIDSEIGKGTEIRVIFNSDGNDR